MVRPPLPLRPGQDDQPLVLLPQVIQRPLGERQDHAVEAVGAGAHGTRDTASNILRHTDTPPSLDVEGRQRRSEGEAGLAPGRPLRPSADRFLLAVSNAGTTASTKAKGSSTARAATPCGNPADRRAAAKGGRADRHGPHRVRPWQLQGRAWAREGGSQGKSRGRHEEPREAMWEAMAGPWGET